MGTAAGQRRVLYSVRAVCIPLPKAICLSQLIYIYCIAAYLQAAVFKTTHGFEDLVLIWMLLLSEITRKEKKNQQQVLAENNLKQWL